MAPSTLPYLFKVSNGTNPFGQILEYWSIVFNVNLEVIHDHYVNIFSAKFEQIFNLMMFEFSFGKISETCDYPCKCFQWIGKALKITNERALFRQNFS